MQSAKSLFTCNVKWNITYENVWSETSYNRLMVGVALNNSAGFTLLCCWTFRRLLRASLSVGGDLSSWSHFREKYNVIYYGYCMLRHSNCFNIIFSTCKMDYHELYPLCAPLFQNSSVHGLLDYWDLTMWEHEEIWILFNSALTFPGFSLECYTHLFLLLITLVCNTNLWIVSS